MNEFNCHDYCEFGKECTVPQGDYYDMDNCKEYYNEHKDDHKKTEEKTHD